MGARKTAQLAPGHRTATGRAEAPRACLPTSVDSPSSTDGAGASMHLLFANSTAAGWVWGRLELHNPEVRRLSRPRRTPLSSTQRGHLPSGWRRGLGSPQRPRHCILVLPRLLSPAPNSEWRRQPPSTRPAQNSLRAEGLPTYLHHSPSP